jgi:dTDP-4-amino-4,6-dideoxygalactose transaminase
VVGLLRERYAPQQVLLTDSGTTALTAALRAVREGRPGAPVAMPAYACYDLATIADGAAVPVLLYDVDPHTLGPDLAQIEGALRRGAAAVVVTHLYGYPVDVAAVSRLAVEMGAVVIEDAAQGAGATVHGRAVGTFGSLAVLSFGRGKGLTGGSGGALLAYNEVGARVLQRARTLLGAPRRGWRELVAITAQLLLDHPNLYAIPASLPFLRLGETMYREPRPLRGPSVAANEIIADTWTLAEWEVGARRRNAQRLLAALQGQVGFSIIRPMDRAWPGYLRLPVLVSAPVRRAAVEPAARRLGLMPGYPKALCDLAGFGSRCINGRADFPGSRFLAEQLCTFPTHGRLEIGDLARLESWIRTVG